MDIKNVWIMDGCIACGMCENVCHEVFRVEDVAYINEGINYGEYSEKIKEAADACPEEVIKYSE